MKPSSVIVALVCAAGIAWAMAPGAVHAAQPVLEVPIACSIPDRCFIEFYVDRADGPPIGDYRCGVRTYDTHRGTDFRVRSPEDFAAGIPVVAAAAGTVTATRDEMADVDVGELGRDKIAGRAGGNVVVLRHDDGWITQYWHMRLGSIAVHKGDRVEAGQRLGTVGLSGDTNFPHLHFEVERERANAPAQVIDPFSGTTATTFCTDTGQALWSMAALKVLTYSNVDTIAGFAAREGSRGDAAYGRLGPPPKAGARKLFFWFELFGVKSNDTIGVQFVLADGTLRKPAQSQINVPVSYVFRTAALDTGDALPAGTYGAILTLRRNGQADPIFTRRFDFELK